MHVSTICYDNEYHWKNNGSVKGIINESTSRRKSSSRKTASVVITAFLQDKGNHAKTFFKKRDTFFSENLLSKPISIFREKNLV